MDNTNAFIPKPPPASSRIIMPSPISIPPPPTPKKSHLFLYFFIFIIALILILVALFFVFKDQLIGSAGYTQLKSLTQTYNTQSTVVENDLAMIDLSKVVSTSTSASMQRHVDTTTQDLEQLNAIVNEITTLVSTSSPSITFSSGDTDIKGLYSTCYLARADALTNFQTGLTNATLFLKAFNVLSAYQTDIQVFNNENALVSAAMKTKNDADTLTHLTLAIQDLTQIQSEVHQANEFVPLPALAFQDTYISSMLTDFNQMKTAVEKHSTTLLLSATKDIASLNTQEAGVAGQMMSQVQDWYTKNILNNFSIAQTKINDVNSVCDQAENSKHVLIDVDKIKNIIFQSLGQSPSTNETLIVATSTVTTSLPTQSNVVSSTTTVTTITTSTTTVATSTTTSTQASVVSKNGTLTFSVGNDLEYKSYGSSTSASAIVLSHKGTLITSTNDSCGPGEPVFQIAEADGLTTRALYSNGLSAPTAQNKKFVQTATFGGKTYDVFKWVFGSSNEQVLYYVTYTNKSAIEVSARIDPPCVQDANYKSDLNVLLSTFSYKAN